jgi:hypothetical protein
MSRPTNVRILNLDFRIVWVEGAQARLMEHSGEIFFEEQVILINTNRTLQWQADTLLHEIIHGLCRVMGFEDYEWKEDDEDFTGRISSGLCTVWLHNPELMSWLHRSITASPPPESMVTVQITSALKRTEEISRTFHDQP